MSFLNKRIQFGTALRKRKNLRNPANFPCDGAGVPLRITRVRDLVLPEVTIDSIKEKKLDKSDVVCINEMMTLFDCFQKHDYVRDQCKQQMLSLESCYSSHLKSNRDLKSKKK